MDGRCLQIGINHAMSYYTKYEFTAFVHIIRTPCDTAFTGTAVCIMYTHIYRSSQIQLRSGDGVLFTRYFVIREKEVGGEVKRSRSSKIYEVFKWRFECFPPQKLSCWIGTE